MRDQLEDLVNNIVDEDKKVRVSLERLNAVINQLKSRVIDSNLLEQTWQQHVNTINAACNITTIPPSKAGIPPPAAPPHMSLTPASMMPGGSGGGGESAVTAMAKTPAIAATLVGKLKDSWQHLLRDRAARALTFNDEQFHLLEKLKMKETAKSLECLFSCCTVTINTATDALADWCKVAQVQRVQADIASSDLTKHSVQLSKLQVELRNTQDSYHSFANKLLNIVQDTALQDTNLALQDTSLALQVDAGKSILPRNLLNESCLPEKDRKVPPAEKRHKNKATKEAIVRNLQRVTEKQEATFRLLEEAKNLTAAVQQTVALTRPH